MTTKVMLTSLWRFMPTRSRAAHDQPVETKGADWHLSSEHVNALPEQQLYVRNLLLTDQHDPLVPM